MCDVTLDESAEAEICYRWSDVVRRRRISMFAELPMAEKTLQMELYAFGCHVGFRTSSFQLHVSKTFLDCLQNVSEFISIIACVVVSAAFHVMLSILNCNGATWPVDAPDVVSDPCGLFGQADLWFWSNRCLIPGGVERVQCHACGEGWLLVLAPHRHLCECGVELIQAAKDVQAVRTPDFVKSVKRARHRMFLLRGLKTDGLLMWIRGVC